MSSPRIVLPPNFPSPVCTTCVHFQLLSFREQIKEQWNRYLGDKRNKVVDIPFIIDSGLILEEGIIEASGTLYCITHFLVRENIAIEGNQKGPLVAAERAIPAEVRKLITG